MLRSFLKCERGATAVEYGLIIALVFLAIMVAVNQLAQDMNGMYGYIGSALSNSLTP